MGDVIFFKKPSKTLKVIINTDKDVYMPGDEVFYNVSVYDTSTGNFVSTDAYVSITVTDDSVF